MRLRELLSLQERWEEPDADYAAVKMSQGDGRAAKVKRFYPFSSGNRDCAGQSLARMNYTATVAMLSACFSFQLAQEVHISQFSGPSRGETCQLMGLSNCDSTRYSRLKAHTVSGNYQAALPVLP